MSIPLAGSHQINQNQNKTPRSHHNALAAPRRLGRLLELLDLSDHQIKRPLDVVVQPGTGLGERAVQLFFQTPALVQRDLPLVGLEVALVANHDQRYLIRALES